MSQLVPEETSKSAEAHVAENPRISFGSWLRHQREARSVSVREIADNSKISLRYLEALEQDRFDVLPAPVFARGFLREYARVVGLNPDEVVNLYLVAMEEREAASQRSERPKAGASGKPELGALFARLWSASWPGGRPLRGHRGAALFSRRTPPRSAARIQARRAGDDGCVHAVRLPRRISPPSLADSPSGRTQASAGEAPGAFGEQTESAAGEVTGAPVVGPFRVVLNFSQDCWMESVVDGNRRTSELKAAGETVQLEAFQAVVLTLGNSRAVTVEVDGVPFVLPENSTRVVRDLRIERPGRPDSRPGGVIPTPSASSVPSETPPVRR